MTAVGPEYEFLFKNVSTNQRNSDGSSWLWSPVIKALEEKSFDLPKAPPLPGRSVVIPNVIVVTTFSH